MRKIFFQTLAEEFKKDKSIFMLFADLGVKFFYDLKKIDPERVIDVGVAEANMIDVASGLAMSGKNVYCYSIIPFLIDRALDQIRVDIAYNNLNIKLLGAGGGVVYGLEGVTHHSVNDIAIMRSLPNMTVVAPGDVKEAIALAKASIGFPGPLYVRFGRDCEPEVHREEIDFKTGKGIVVNKGKDICLIATGSTMLSAAIEVTDRLSKEGKNPTLVSMHTIKPLDRELIFDLAKDHSQIITLEDHNVIGGLGSAVSEVLLEGGYKGAFRRIGIPDTFSEHVGRPDYLMEKLGLDSKTIYDKLYFLDKLKNHDL